MSALHGGGPTGRLDPPSNGRHFEELHRRLRSAQQRRPFPQLEAGHSLQEVRGSRPRPAEPETQRRADMFEGMEG